MKKLFSLLLYIIFFNSLSAQETYIELGRKLDFGNVGVLSDLDGQLSYTSNVIYDNHIYITGLMVSPPPTSFPTTNNTQATVGDAAYFFLYVCDTLGNPVYSTTHFFSPYTTTLQPKINLKVDNGNVYITFDTDGNVVSTNGSTPSSNSSTMLVYFSESTIQNNGNIYDFATYLGGDYFESIGDFEVKNDNVYILQETSSTNKFVTNGSQIHNSTDGYLIKISSTTIANNLQISQDANNYATYIGGSLTETYYANTFKIDDDENIYLAFQTESSDIVTTNGTTVTNIGTDDHSIIYKISAYSIENDLPINTGISDFCTYIPYNDADMVSSLSFKNGILYVFGTITGDNLQTTGGVNSTSGVSATFLMSYSTASMNNNSTHPDYFQIFQDVMSLSGYMQFYDDNLYIASRYFDSNINTTDGSTLNGSADYFLCKVNTSVLASNLNWIDNAEFLISFGCEGDNERVSHFEVNDLGIHMLFHHCLDPVNIPTNGTGLFSNTDSEYYLNYCLNGDLQYSTQYSLYGLWGDFAAKLNNSIYIYGFCDEVVQTTPIVVNPNQLGYGIAGFTKITFFRPEILEQDSIFPLTQTVCQYGLAEVLDGEDLGSLNDTLPDLYYMGSTINQYSNPNPYSYQWQSAVTSSGPWTNISNGILEDYLPTVATQDLYYRRLAYFKSCSDTLIASTSIVVPVLVNNDNAPQADAGGVQHTCTGTAITLGGTPSSSGGTSPYTYSWDNGLNSIANPSFTANAHSIVSLTVTDALGCKDLDQVTVYAHQANAGNDASICNGQSVTIGSNAVQGLPDVVYSWTPTTDLSCSDCPFPTVNSTQNQTYTQTLTIPLLNGGVCQTTDQINITQVSGPSNPNFAGPDKTICFESSVELGTPAESGFTYSWYPGSSLNNTTTAQPIFYSDGGAFPPIPDPSNYYLVATKNGCDFTDNVTISEIRANAGINACGPRIIGTGDVTPDLDETYSWTLISGPGSFTGPTDTPTTTVSSSPGVTSVYQLEVSLNGVTCTDQVKVKDCGCTIFEITSNSSIGCPSYLLTNDSIQLTAGPGHSNYSNLNYSWSPSVGLSSYNTQTVTLQTDAPTTYTVTITDPLDNNLFCTQEIEVNTPTWSIPVFNEVDTVLCAIAPISIGSTAIPIYTYSWYDYTGIISTNSNPIVTPKLGTNNYNLTVIDVNSGCRLHTTSEVFVQEFDPSIGGDWYVCENGLVQLSNTTLPNVNYSWSPSNAPWQNGTTNTSAQPTVIVTSDITFSAALTNTLNGCESIKEVDVFVDQMPSFGTLQDVNLCRDGTVQLGNPPVNGVVYSWSPAEGLSCTDCAQPYANPLNTTTYQVTMSLVGNCLTPVTQSVEIQVNGGNLSLPDITFCPSDGAINLWTNGPYNYNSYHWEPANIVSAQDIPNPSSLVQTEATFYLSVEDNNGCTIRDTIQVFPTIPSPNAGTNKSICLGDGSVTLGTNANTGSIVWSPAANLDNPTLPAPIFTPTHAGTYDFVISQTVNGCTATDSVKIIVDEFSVGSIDSKFICSNSCTPIGVTAQPGLTYSWFPNNGLNSTTISNPIACPTESTDYTLVATGLNGCVDIQTTSITVSDLLTPDVQIPSIHACSDDLVNSVNPDIQPSGDYSYQWMPSLGLSATNIPNPDVYVFGLGHTSYNLTVTDQLSGCVGTGVFDFYVTNCIVTPCEIPFDIISSSDTICSGENISISFTSDSANVVYSWTIVGNNVQGATNGIGSSINQNIINSSSSLGKVTYTIKPEIGSCTGAVQKITIYVAPNPISEIVGSYTVCDGGSVQLGSVNSAFEYEWSNGTTDSSTYFTALDNPIHLSVTNKFSCITISEEVTLIESNSSTTNQDKTICEGNFYEINGNQYTVSGTYTDVLISDNGCDSSVITDLAVNPIYTINNPQVICQGQSYQLNGNSYSVTGIYTDVFQMDSGCDSTVITDLTVNPIYPINNPQVICQGQSYQLNGNSYSVTGIYTDVFQTGSGCDSTVITDLTVNPLPNPVFLGNGEYCAGSSFTVGTSDSFTSYDWSTGSTNTTISATIADNPITVTVTNSSGCSATSAALNVSEVGALTYNSTVEICSGETVNIHGNQESVGGIYSATFSSTSGCDSLSKVTLVILPLPDIFAGDDVVVCQGDSVTLNATGGSNYVWTGGVQNNIPFVPTTGGTYTVTAANSVGCENTEQVTVIVNENPSYLINTTEPSCFGECDGSADAIASGGTTPYIYVWTDQNGDTIASNTNNVSDLCDGEYYVEVSDGNGCSIAGNTVLTEPQKPDATFSGLASNYCIEDGSVMLVPTQTGGVFSGPGINGTTFTPGDAGIGSYAITYTVGNPDCGASTLVNVEVGGPSASFTASPLVTTVENTNVVFTNGSQNATDYIWVFGDNSVNSNDENPTHTFPNNKQGTYIVLLTALDDNNCSDSQIITITITVPGIEYEIPNVFTPNGDDENDFFQLIYSYNIKSIEVLVLNRWGNPVFESDKVNFEWNGKINNSGAECTDGTYFYKMILKDINGNETVEHGFVQISRGE